MIANEDESLAHVGHSIYTLLEQIAIVRTRLPHTSEVLQALNLIINDGDRFKIWSISAGLLIPGHGSLDYRVREADNLSETFRSFLTDLRENLEEVLLLNLQDDPAIQSEDGAARDDSEGDDDIDDSDILSTLLESIRDIIDRLFRLATKLRSPETRLRSSRSRNFQILDNGVDLFECFVKFEIDYVSSIFKLCRHRNQSASSAEYAASPDRDLNFDYRNEASGYLIERIALANVARRRQFAYWKYHRLKLEKHTEAAIAARSVLDPTKATEIPPISNNLIPTNPTPAMTVSTATQLLHPARGFNDLVSIATVSEYVPSPAGHHGDVVIFPSPPHVATDSKFFECRYCFTTCAKKTSRLKAWRAHLIHDLRPYICTYEGCRTADQLYDTKSDWIQHETTSHATSWKCSVHPNELFDDLVAFRLHAADGHVQNVSVDESTQAVTSAELTNMPGRSCPVCTMSGLPVAQMNDHIAAHLERLAIFSFPKHTGMAEADEDEENDRGSNDAMDEEDSRRLDVDSNLSFDSAPASVVDENLQRGKDSSLTSIKPQVKVSQPSMREGEPLTETTINEQVNVIAQEGSNRNALVAAAERGHTTAVLQLLDQGADINASEGDYGTALVAASAAGHIEIVQLLLDRPGIDINAEGGLYGNALVVASAGGFTNIVQLLVDRGADINAQSGDYGNALQAASADGHIEVVQLLIENGADVSAQGGLYDSALQAASAGGHIAIVQLLLDNGADADSHGGLYGTALQAALTGGHVEVVQLLKKSTNAHTNS